MYLKREGVEVREFRKWNPQGRVKMQARSPSHALPNLPHKVRITMSC